MKTFARAALVAAAALSLSACGGKGDDTLADNVAEAAENQADALEEMADNASTEGQEDALENKAEAVRDAGEAKEDAIDDADVNAASMTAAEKEAMKK
jgi:predicted small lipoprotein YifL